MTDKESARSAWSRILAVHKAAPQWGRAAEKLRGTREYRDAATVFATPADSLHQARINCLADGKNLVMPAPSIRAGFFLLAAHAVPFRDRSIAVTYKGLEKYGMLLKGGAMEKISVGLLLTGSLAIDLEGGRIGDGNGFFDLSCALLQEYGALPRDWAVLTLIREEQISRDPLPQDTWDIKMSGAVTPSSVHAFNPQRLIPRVFWKVLPRDRIKRIDPLWKIYSAREKASDSKA
jgi:5-formyltetrahydrofolate cyclo-ligase